MPKSIFSFTNVHFLRNTTLFGVYQRFPEPNGAPSEPRIMPNSSEFSELRNPYCPDILNDLQLTDHYPMVQKVQLGEQEINVISLNCMRQCLRLPAFYNNGFEKEETPREYAQRLDLLVKLVITLIQENPAMSFSLQEAPDYNSAVGKKFFNDILTQTGWKYVDDDTSCQQVGLVTLYNPEILTPEVIEPSRRGSRFQTTIFSVNDNSRTPFRLINMHGQLDNSKHYAELISEISSESNPETIVTGDTNIPASEYAIQALAANNSEDKLEQHRQVLSTLNQQGIYGGWTIVKGTINESKNGVDTLDVIAFSPVFCNEQSRELTTIPELDQELIANSRLANHRLTQNIRDSLTNTIKELSKSQEAETLEVSRYPDSLYSSRKVVEELPQIELSFFTEKFDASIREMLNPRLSHLRALVFASREEALNFSTWLTRNYYIPMKSPRPFGNLGKYSILLSITTLYEIQLNNDLAEPYVGKNSAEETKHSFAGGW